MFSGEGGDRSRGEVGEELMPTEDSRADHSSKTLNNKFLEVMEFYSSRESPTF